MRAYAYIRAHGAAGLREVSEDAVLAANYLKHRLAGAYVIPFPQPCMHEFVASSSEIKAATGVRTLDVAKRLIDKGFHPPTIYFPLTVEEGMLIEPTETESLETLDAFAEAMLEIAREARETPELVKEAPHTRARPPPGRGDGRPAAQPALALRHRRGPLGLNIREVATDTARLGEVR